MAQIMRGMRNWLSYSTMNEEEWECLRETHIEQEVRRLIRSLADESCHASDRELGQVSVPVRTGALRQVRRLRGKVFISKDSDEWGDRYRLHVMVPSASQDLEESWEPVCSWAFDSVHDVREFIGEDIPSPVS